MVIYSPLTVHFYSFLYLPYAPPLRLACSLTYSRLSKSIYRNIYFYKLFTRWKSCLSLNPYFSI
uniref:Uncharacterized protein n=1 Tax=Heterorhabditis bacteriophora TaxID=37862 RepID=A0A1I7WHC1_HETBA